MPNQTCSSNPVLPALDLSSPCRCSSFYTSRRVFAEPPRLLVVEAATKVATQSGADGGQRDVSWCLFCCTLTQYLCQSALKVKVERFKSKVTVCGENIIWRFIYEVIINILQANAIIGFKYLCYFLLVLPLKVNDAAKALIRLRESLAAHTNRLGLMFGLAERSDKTLVQATLTPSKRSAKHTILPCCL